MSRVGIDLDGVCYDFGHAFATYAVERGHLKGMPPPPQRWEFYLDWGLTEQQFLTICNEAVNACYLFRVGMVEQNARFELDRLKAAGHEIIFVTDRTFGTPAERSQLNTHYWLEYRGIPYDEIHFTADKAAVKLDYMIDDKPENVDALLAVGVDAWLLDQAWNRHRSLPRVETLERFVDHVLWATEPAPLELGEDQGEADVLGAVYAKIADQVAQAKDGEVRSVSSTGAEKGTKLARYDLIPAEPLRLLAEHYGRGARKYADRNWEAGYEWGKSFTALNRHLWAFWAGEDIDPETGSPHLAAVAWHAFTMLEYGTTHKEFDDRPAR